MEIYAFSIMRKWKWVFIAVVFLAGLYTSLKYGTRRFTEPFQPRCPDILVQKGSEIWLKNSKLAEIPGVNPVKFRNLEEYTEFVEWQQSQKIDCPVLFLQHSFDAQNESSFKVAPAPGLRVDTTRGNKLTDATRGNPPFNRNSYPAMDLYNQDVGRRTVLDVYGDVGETQAQSANPMDPNWGGAEYSMAAINAGNYAGDEVYKFVPQNVGTMGPVHRAPGERDLRILSEPNSTSRDLPYLESAGNYIDMPKQSLNVYETPRNNPPGKGSASVPMEKMKQTVLAQEKIDDARKI